MTQNINYSGKAADVKKLPFPLAVLYVTRYKSNALL